MKLLFIHGATASHRSFAFLAEKLKYSNIDYIEYDSENRFCDNLEEIKSQFQKINEKVFVVAHSLGGIYTIHLTNVFSDKIAEVVSLSTPFNGSELALWASLMHPGYSLFKDISPGSEPIHQSNKIKISIPWTQIVSTKGNAPWIGSRNDGVVTYKSMTHRTDVNYIEIDRNHYEIVQSQRVFEFINDRLLVNSNT